MPKLCYNLYIHGEIEVDNAIYMLDEVGQKQLITEDVLLNHKVDMRDVDYVEFEIVDD